FESIHTRQMLHCTHNMSRVTLHTHTHTHTHNHYTHQIPLLFFSSHTGPLTPCTDNMSRLTPHTHTHTHTHNNRCSSSAPPLDRWYPARTTCLDSPYTHTHTHTHTQKLYHYTLFRYC